MNPLQSKQVAWNTLGDCVVILDMSNQKEHQIHELSLEASFIWKKCDGLQSIESIANDLSSEFDVDIDSAMTDVQSFLNEMKTLQLISFK